MIVSAPPAGEIAKRLMNGNSRAVQPPASSPKRDATMPGCRQLAVTLVPARRLASSRVKRMLASFERL